MESNASDKDDTFGQIMTEYWIEPQMGTGRVKGESCSYLNGKDFKAIGDAVSHCIVQQTPSYLTVDQGFAITSSYRRFRLFFNSGMCMHP